MGRSSSVSGERGEIVEWELRRSFGEVGVEEWCGSSEFVESGENYLPRWLLGFEGERENISCAVFS